MIVLDIVDILHIANYALYEHKRILASSEILAGLELEGGGAKNSKQTLVSEMLGF